MFSAEQIIGKLRGAEVEVARGKTAPKAVRKLGVTEQTYYRWKQDYGGLRTGQAKRLKDLEKEDTRLKRLLAAAELDKAILREAASGCRRRATAESFRPRIPNSDQRSVEAINKSTPHCEGSGNTSIMHTASIFGPALSEMCRSSTATFGPLSFREYLKTHDLPLTGTAAAISVDSIRALSIDLVEARTMVFRLGAAIRTRHTTFALCRYRDSWTDLFLQDECISGSQSSVPFFATGLDRNIAAYRLLPRLTEPSIVNLAIAFGILAAALELDDADRSPVPATGQSTCSLDVRPYDDSIAWQHRQGQVEINCIFVGHRNGRDGLFLVEAKCSCSFASLAKHKLVFPYQALRRNG
jgi:hypothetical protein